MIDLKATASFEVPWRPRPGQVIFFVDLAGATNPLEILAIVQELGYAPVLKYRRLSNGQTTLCALLKFEQHEGSYPQDDYLGEEFEALCHTGIEPERIHCQKGRFPIALAA